MSLRLRYRPVTVPLPSRYRYTVTVIDRRPTIPYRYLTVTHRYPPLPTLRTVTHRYPPLPTVTHRYHY
jgi:hypothetical protein